MEIFVFFFKQKTAYEMRISDWSSDVCSSDLIHIDMRYSTSLCLHDNTVFLYRYIIRRRRAELGNHAFLGGSETLITKHINAEHGPNSAIAFQNETEPKSKKERTAGRERGGQYVRKSVDAGLLKKKKKSTR